MSTPIVVFLNFTVVAIFLFAIIGLITYYVVRFIYFGFDISIFLESRAGYEESEETQQSYTLLNNNEGSSAETSVTDTGDSKANADMSADMSKGNVSNESVSASTLAIEEGLSKWESQKRYKDKETSIVLLASEIGTNRTTLSQYFNHTLNMSYREWINGIRLREAKKLIDEYKEYTLDTIADMAGFSSRTYFHRVFTESTGMTPSQWRDRRK